MNCRDYTVDDLSLLISDESLSVDSKPLLEHLESCVECQANLRRLAADDSWWSRAHNGLQSADTNESKQLLDVVDSNSCVDLIFDLEEPGSTESFWSREVDASVILDPSPHAETLGRIDEFEIEEKIGQGGMGVVFRGFDRSLNRPVAIKVMAPHLGSHPTARKRFAREAQAAAAVVHPNVVPIYRVSSTQSRPYIAMALADGQSLQEHVTENGPMDVKDVVRIGLQVASGLAAAHRQGLIHRDIKPANVLMEKDVSRIMITDFGLARAIDDVVMTQSGCLAGTPHYMSPEQVAGKELDHRSDLFSLGALMYFIVTGREPFQADSAFAVINKITQHRPQPPREINPSVPEVLNRIIERLLEKNPEDRIASAEVLEELLTRVLAHLQEPAQHNPPNVGSTSLERNQLKRQIFAVGATIVFGLILFLSVRLFMGTQDRVGPERQGDNHGLREGGEHEQSESHDSGE